ncbi:hypothetical protein [Paludisphaera mucosa]|uniref:Uncharacterized protein n=1 Tax=Paludisphaera mucosa TaxID=3030827 RepID=A0ABT6FHH1_9BACT|nr:hypothetical protein [Paludisphaera mucosa]MDG3007027.1 hypothetical protein [Paludisphaera mucosa]
MDADRIRQVESAGGGAKPRPSARFRSIGWLMAVVVIAALLVARLKHSNIRETVFGLIIPAIVWSVVWIIGVFRAWLRNRPISEAPIDGVVLEATLPHFLQRR